MSLKSLSLNKQSESFEGISSSRLLPPETSALFEDILNKGLDLRVKVTGRSMAPFLHGGEILTIKKVPSASLRIGDLIFFKTKEGFPLLHRILRKKCITDKSSGDTEDKKYNPPSPPLRKGGKGGFSGKKNMHIFQTKGEALFSLDDPISETEILGKVCSIEKTASGGKIKQLDLESRLWRTINYFIAVISLFRPKISSAFLKSGFYTSFRHIIKKVLT